MKKKVISIFIAIIFICLNVNVVFADAVQEKIWNLSEVGGFTSAGVNVAAFVYYVVLGVFTVRVIFLGGKLAWYSGGITPDTGDSTILATVKAEFSSAFGGILIVYLIKYVVFDITLKAFGVNVSLGFDPLDMNEPAILDPTINGEIDTYLGMIWGYSQYIAYAFAIAAIMFLAINWIRSSPEGKVALRKQLPVWTIGIILVTKANVIVMQIVKWIAG